MNPTILDRVKQASLRMQTVMREADKVLAPRPDLTKQVPVEVSRAIPFLTGDFSMRTATFVNGGDDIHLTRLGCEVRLVRPTPVPPIDPALGAYDWLMAPQQQGFYPASVLEDRAIGPLPMFDFTWNYQVASTQTSFGSSANQVSMLPRAVLGNSDTGEGLTLDQPGQIVRAGDTLTFFVQPVLFPFPGSDPQEAAWPYSGTSFVVRMFAVGRRGGVMAEAAYVRR